VLAKIEEENYTEEEREEKRLRFIKI